MKIKKHLRGLYWACIVVVICLVAVAIRPTADAADANALVTQINGINGLIAVESSGVVTVTGSTTTTSTGAVSTIPLNIDPGVEVLWKADLTAIDCVAINVSGSGTFELAEGGSIKTKGSSNMIFNATGQNALVNTSGSPTIVVSGGLIDVSCFRDPSYTGFQFSIDRSAIAAKCPVEISGGVVRNMNGDTINVADATLKVTGGVIESTADSGNSRAIYCNKPIEINGGTISSVKGPTIHYGGNLTIEEKSGSSVYISSQMKNNSTMGVLESARSSTLLTINSGTIECLAGSGSGTGVVHSCGDITINGGNLISDFNRCIYSSEAVSFSGPPTNTPTININGGYIEVAGMGSVFANDSTIKVTVNITGGKITSPANTSNGVSISGNGSKCNISGGMVFMPGLESIKTTNLEPYAVNVNNGSTLTVGGNAVLFSRGSTESSVVKVNGTGTFNGFDGESVGISFAKPATAQSMQYFIGGTKTNLADNQQELFFYPQTGTTADGYWHYDQTEEDSVYYKRGSNEGVIHLDRIRVGQKPVITSPTTLTDPIEGTPYTSTQIAATGNPTITYSASGLPAGMSISTSGAITGTPTASGNFTVVVSATNNFGSGTKTYPITVKSGFRVTYSGNGSTSGSVPSDSNVYSANASVTALGNTGGLTKPNLSFGGWTTGGSIYQANDSFFIQSNTVLNAVWNATVTYDKNNADAGSIEASPQTDNVRENSSVGTLPTPPIRTGYTFKGWSTNQLSNSIDFTDITTVTENTRVYAVWSKNTKPPRPNLDGEYSVTYDLLEKGTSTGPLRETVTEKTSPKNVPEVKANQGYAFKYWSLTKPTADDPEPMKTDPSTYTVESDTTFYAVYIECDVHEMYLKGLPGGLFGPDNDITRAEVAMIFARILTEGFIEENDYGDGGYSDLKDSDHWAKSAIAYCSDKKIFIGTDKGTFEPSRNITREEFMLALARVKGVEAAGSMGFKDTTSISDWALDGVFTNVNNGWVNGYVDNTIRPQDDIIRSEVTKIVNIYLNRGVDADGIGEYQCKKWPDVSEGYWAYHHINEACNTHSYIYRDGANPPEDWM